MNTTPRNNGVGVHWGVSSTSITGYGILSITGTSQGLDGDTATATNGNGFVVTEVTYNHRETATLDVWFSGSASSTNITIASASVPQPGDLVTIVDSVDTGLAGTNWIAGSMNINRSATDLAKASVSLRRYALI